MLFFLSLSQRPIGFCVPHRTGRLLLMDRIQRTSHGTSTRHDELTGGLSFPADAPPSKSAIKTELLSKRMLSGDEESHIILLSVLRGGRFRSRPQGGNLTTDLPARTSLFQGVCIGRAGAKCQQKVVEFQPSLTVAASPPLAL